MDETKKNYAQKRSIILTKEQEEKIAQQNHQAIQNYVNEMNQVQSRRLELASGILVASMTGGWTPNNVEDHVAICRKTADALVNADCAERFTRLKALFEELGVRGPIPALEWGAKQAGVTLFDPLPELEWGAKQAGEPLVKLAEPLNIDELTKVIQ